MSTLFTAIIEGEIPGRFVWRDDRAVVFLTINPITTGHALVVPIAEVDHWLDLEPSLAQHLMEVAQIVGRAQMVAFAPNRVGLIIAGLEVPHTHLHVLPITTEGDLSFAKADLDADPDDLDMAADDLRGALRALDYEDREPAADGKLPG
jgi:histidine triad (HIT) family protein